MRTLLFILLSYSSLFSASMFTLENVNNLNVYLVQSTDFMDTQKEDEIKALIKKRLLSKGITSGNVDPATVFVRIESVSIKEITVIHVMLGLGEEVTSKRKDAIETFAFTYHASDMMESEKNDAYVDTIESIEMLVGEFLETYVEDNE